ncbi:NADH:ubiquinone oxidoreductase 10.4kD subunit [Apodospora peruviana]|uniref:NADH:ubiquinone oxidoreductase 10.4kD subunit n=1 Tax=Apodospora peruviana TaxID=516989 RepID=A0AAE0IK35_9PEZI|nr:NADH:ubiquinone oxidoreductase 10.4kD subunit [Apodospora peruviana]
MVNRLIFWTTFGLVTRAWQLGLEMRPIISRRTLWIYPVYGGVGASFGYWLQGVDERQTEVLAERKKAIMEKRARRAAREGSGASDAPAIPVPAVVAAKQEA